MKDGVKEFAESIEGQNIIILHEQGYKLTDLYKDLTPLQSLFLIYALNHRTKLQQAEIDRATSGQGKTTGNSESSNALAERVQQRWKERGEI